MANHPHPPYLKLFLFFSPFRAQSFNIKDLADIIHGLYKQVLLIDQAVLCLEGTWRYINQLLLLWWLYQYSAVFVFSLHIAFHAYALSRTT